MGKQAHFPWVLGGHCTPCEKVGAHPGCPRPQFLTTQPPWGSQVATPGCWAGCWEAWCPCEEDAIHAHALSPPLCQLSILSYLPSLSLIVLSGTRMHFLTVVSAVANNSLRLRTSAREAWSPGPPFQSAAGSYQPVICVLQRSLSSLSCKPAPSVWQLVSPGFFFLLASL